MYQPLEAIGIRYGINKRWEIISLTTITVAQLFATYRKVQLKVQAPDDPDVEYLDLEKLASEFQSFTGTVLSLLTQLDDRALPTIPTGVVINPRKALFKDAIRAGYDLTPVTAINGLGAGLDLTSKPHLRLTRGDTEFDYNYMFEHCLVSVNGFYHQTDTSGVDGLVVKDATRSLLISGENHVGILSFANVCPLEFRPITEPMFSHLAPGQAVIDLGTTVVGKSVMLIFAGYMVFVDGEALKPYGETTYLVDLNKLNLVERYFEARRYLDVSLLDITPAPENLDQISIADLTDQETTRRWFNMSQTFFVVLDCPEMYVNRFQLQRSGLPHLYITHHRPDYPIALELGRQPAYLAQEEDNAWRITLHDNVIGNELYYSNPLPTWTNTVGGDLSGRPTHLSAAQLLEIGRDY